MAWPRRDRWCHRGYNDPEHLSPANPDLAPNAVSHAPSLVVPSRRTDSHV
jgi:hypothetical protein